MSARCCPSCGILGFEPVGRNLPVRFGGLTQFFWRPTARGPIKVGLPVSGNGGNSARGVVQLNAVAMRTRADCLRLTLPALRSKRVSAIDGSPRCTDLLDRLAEAEVARDEEECGQQARYMAMIGRRVHRSIDTKRFAQCLEAHGYTPTPR